MKQTERYCVITSNGLYFVRCSDDEEAAYTALDIAQDQSSDLIDVFNYEKA